MYPNNPFPPQFPQYPTQPPYPTQPQYPAQPAVPAQPTPPPVAGSLDQFYRQPGGARGPAWSFRGKPVGTSYTGIVARPVTDADIEQQTDLTTGAPRYFRDGRPMFVMVVPMLVQPSPEFPEGRAAWYVRGQVRDELVRAMAEAGAPEGPPEAGAVITVTLVGQRPARSAGLNPTNLYRVEYRRPDGAQPAAAAQPQTAPVVSTATGQPVVHQQPVPPAPQPAQQPVPATQQPAQPPAPAGLSPEQQALLAKLTGG